MRRRPALFAMLFALAGGCGSSSSGTPDAGNGGGDVDGGGGGSGDDGGGGTSGGRTVSVTLEGRPDDPSAFSFLVAYQDGSAPWKLAGAPAGDVYSFDVNAPSYGVAFACIGRSTTGGSATVRSVTSAHFAVSERTSLTLDVPARCSDRAPTAVMLTGTVTNRPFTGVLVVQFGTTSTFVSNQSGNFTLRTPPGTHDLVISHAVPTGNGDFYVDETLVVRDVAVTANANKTFDFNAAESVEFYDVDAFVNNARVVAGTTLYTANGTTVGLTRLDGNHASAGLADSQRRATDVYDQSITVSTFGRSATITHATSMPDEQTWIAPAPLTSVTTTIPTKQPYVTLETNWSAYANAVGYIWSATQQTPCSGGSCTTVWNAYLSPGVTGAMPAYRMPDLSGLAGWDSDFVIASGAQTVGNVTAVTSSAGAADFPTTGIPAAGTDRVFVRADYALTP